MAAVLACVDALLARALEARDEQSAASAPEPFTGLYVSANEVLRLVQRGSEPLATRFPGIRPVIDLDEAGPAWRYLAGSFELTPPEVDILAIAMAPDVDLRYERIFGYLHDDLTRRRPTIDLVLQLLCESFDERIAARALFEPTGTLVRYGLLEVVPDATQPHAPPIASAIKLDERIVAFLLGAHGTDARLKDALAVDLEGPTRELPAEYAALTQRILDGGGTTDGEATHLVLAGPDERMKMDVARTAAGRAGRPLLVLDLERLAQTELPLGRALFLALREVRLHRALLLCRHADVLRGEGSTATPAPMDEFLRATDATSVGQTMLACRAPLDDSARSAGRLIAVSCPLPDADARHTLWRSNLTEVAADLPAVDVRLLAEVFPFDAEVIERAVRHAAASAAWRDDASAGITRRDVFAGAHAQTRRVLPRLATRLETWQGWNDLVLPPDPLRQLRELCDRVSHRHTVLTAWGFERRLTLGRGIAALFAGPSGSGKTMAAQVIAATLGLELYRVDIPGVVSKYIGETEKILDQLFREAQGASAILFFDEADALFGKRSEVKEAHDRYANIEISYLLQALEQYDGLTLLATNLRHNLDDAFVRRLAFVVSFPMPEERERQRIWERSWPASTPVAGDVDVAFLARQFKLSGGNIRNVALAAAYTAAAVGDAVSMTHVIRGVRREYQKMGKVCAESDFGAYYELLVPTAVAS